MLTNTPLQFSEAIRDAGLICDNIIADGKIHRFKTTGDHEPNSWYVLHENPILAGAFGCWKRGVSEKWCSKSVEHLSPTEKRDYEEQIKQAKIAEEAERERMYQATREKAQKIWEKSSFASSDNLYLKAKEVKGYGIKQYKTTLLVPLYDNNNLLHGLQYIYTKDNKFEKRFLKGSLKRGNYFQIGEPQDVIYIAEGYATAATIHEVTGKCTIIAFDSNNLLPVAQNIYQKYPNHSIIICADNDAFSEDDINVGVEKATAAAQVIKAEVVIPQFKNIATKPTDFNDLMTLEGIDEVRQQLVSTMNSEADLIVSEEDIIPDGYYVDDTGVYFEQLDKEGNPLPKVFICSKIDVVACTRDSNSINHGRLLQFNDTNGKQHQWAMPMEALAGDGVDYRRSLLNMWAVLNPGKKAREKLTDYLSNSQPKNVILCINRIGWCKGAFVLPDEVIGNTGDEKIIFQSMAYDIAGFKINGSLEEWRNNIAKFCAGNSRLVLAISVAFAATLLEMLNEESSGFHLNGASSTGKTTVLKVACSVWGERERLQNWRATSNGLEGVAALHNDSLLCLDEMSQVDPKDADETAYMLANGTGKNRSKRDGSLQRKASWRLRFCQN